MLQALCENRDIPEHEHMLRQILLSGAIDAVGHDSGLRYLRDRSVFFEI